MASNMKMHFIFGAIDDEIAEPIDVWSEVQIEENPDGFSGAMEKAKMSKSYVDVREVIVVVDMDQVMKAFSVKTVSGTVIA